MIRCPDTAEYELAEKAVIDLSRSFESRCRRLNLIINSTATSTNFRLALPGVHTPARRGGSAE